MAALRYGGAAAPGPITPASETAREQAGRIEGQARVDNRDSASRFRAAIIGTLGRAPDVIEPGVLLRFATSNKHGDDAGWCRLFDDQRGGVFGCHRSGVSETWQAEREQPMTRKQRAERARHVEQANAERERAQREQWAVNAHRIARLWSQCAPLEPGDSVATYLKHRGLGGVWPLPACLRLHRALPYWRDGEPIGTFPAMVAPLTAPDGRVVALHRTYLTTDGRKADVRYPKKLTGAAGPLAGASIRLHEPLRGILGVAEGIETALAASLASGVPTVAAYCASGLAGFVWPAGVQRLLIFADADKAGREAADTLRARALAARLRCEVLTPSDQGADWCDAWAQRGAVTIEGATA